MTRKLTVLWKPSAEQDLADLWMTAEDPQSIAAAANRLDQDLANGADQMGESRANNIRIAFEAPLGIEFVVSLEDRLVYVLGVWAIDPKP